MDNILEVALKYKQDLFNDTVVEKRNIPCSGIFHNRQVIAYSTLNDKMFFDEEDFDDEDCKGFYLSAHYFASTPVNKIGLEKD